MVLGGGGSGKTCRAWLGAPNPCRMVPTQMAPSSACTLPGGSTESAGCVKGTAGDSVPGHDCVLTLLRTSPDPGINLDWVGEKVAASNTEFWNMPFEFAATATDGCIPGKDDIRCLGSTLAIILAFLKGLAPTPSRPVTMH